MYPIIIPQHKICFSDITKDFFSKKNLSKKYSGLIHKKEKKKFFYKIQENHLGRKLRETLNQ